MQDTLITFVRHGKNVQAPKGTPWEAGPSLNAKGKIQADKTGKYLRHFAFDAVLSSDMNRAAETARAICRYQKNITPEKITFCRELAEHDEIVYGYTSATKINLDGEWTHAHATVKFFKEILKKYKGKRILIAAHGNVIRACIGVSLGFPLHHCPEINLFNCSVSTFAFRGSRVRAIFHINHTDHLKKYPYLRRLESVKFISDYSKLICNGECHKIDR
jgi:broad specificity phosphatase PhoE